MRTACWLGPQDLHGIALACCKAAEALHRHKLVFRDFRRDNLVCHVDDMGWMVIDLETVAEVKAKPHALLADWDAKTLGRRGVYDEQSDMYQVCMCMFKRVCDM